MRMMRCRSDSETRGGGGGLGNICRGSTWLDRVIARDCVRKRERSMGLGDGDTADGRKLIPGILTVQVCRRREISQGITVWKHLVNN